MGARLGRMHPPTSRRRSSVPGAFLLALLFAVLAPAIVAAHAELVTATPADGATVEGTPPELAATFTEPLLPDSTLSIRDGAGTRLAVGGVDPADERRLVIDPVPALAAGTYEMRWSAFTADGHLERGTWSFTVTDPPPSDPPATAAPTEAPSASPAPSASDAPSPSPDASSTPAPSDPAGGDGAAILLPILAALAIVGGGALLLLGRRGRPGPAA